MTDDVPERFASSGGVAQGGVAGLLEIGLVAKLGVLAPPPNEGTSLSEDRGGIVY